MAFWDSPRNFYICNIYFISCFGFKSGICLLIAPVPVHRFSITFEQCLEVTDFKKFDTGNVLPKSMEHVLYVFKIMN